MVALHLKALRLLPSDGFGCSDRHTEHRCVSDKRVFTGPRRRGKRLTPGCGDTKQTGDDETGARCNFPPPTAEQQKCVLPSYRKMKDQCRRTVLSSPGGRELFIQIHANY